ncbi:MAG: DUF1896 family protein [Rikenellaceae bacterium]
MNTNIEFSFYELLLLSFLRESHPELAEKKRFIKGRATQAAEAYAKAFNDGLDTLECREIANNTLYAGLHFSRHDTIVNILWTEFSASVKADYADECAIYLRPSLDPIFKKYTLSDDFAYTAEYQSLYTELVGAIQLKQEEDGKL